jgi:hypothetical protein
MGGLLAQILGARGLAKGLVLLTPASPSGINAKKRKKYLAAVSQANCRKICNESL